MFDEDTILRIRESAIVMERNWVTKIATKKNQNAAKKNRKCQFHFIGLYFHHPTIPPPHCNHHSTRKFVILGLHQTFLRMYPSQSQDLWICDIASFRQIILRIWNSQKCFTKTQYCEFEGPVIVMSVGGGVMKITAKKIKNVGKS